MEKSIERVAARKDADNAEIGPILSAVCSSN